MKIISHLGDIAQHSVFVAHSFEDFRKGLAYSTRNIITQTTYHNTVLHLD